MPISIVGQAKTVLEVNGGSIHLDFDDSEPESDGTPLSIKKSKIARISICEVRFNRAKAATMQ